MQLDVLSVGDALLDLFLDISKADEHCHASEENKEICFTSGAKIPVNDCQFLLGGNACNASVALKRLGLRAGLAAETGDDEFSHKIITGLQREHVDLTFFKQTPNAQASFSIDLLFMNDRTIFSRHVQRDHDLSFDNLQCSYIYLTSVGEEWKSLYAKVLLYAQKNKAKLAFNPGSKQLQAGVDSFKNILPETEILFINKEEAEDIVYGSDQNIPDELKKPETLLQEVQKLGPNIVSMTDGKKGSYCIDENGKVFFQEIIPSTFIQNTGVGDAYASGCLAAVLHGLGDDLQTVMQWGAANSASVVEHIGAQIGLLTKKQMEEKIKSL